MSSSFSIKLRGLRFKPLLKRLLKRLFIAAPIQLPPAGYTPVTEPRFWLYRVITATLRALVGDRISQAQGFGFTHEERIHYYENSHSPKTILTLSPWRDPILRSGGRCFRTLCTLSALFAFTFGKAVFFLPLIAWGWLGYEMAKVEQDQIKQKPIKQDKIKQDQIRQNKLKQKKQQSIQAIYTESFGYVIGKLMIVAAASVGLSVLFCFLFYWPTFGLAGWMLPFLLTGFFGAYAVMVRLLRSPPNQSHYTSPKHSPIRCQACKLPMKKLSAIQLRQHLTPAQHTEVTLKSNYYEGWQCQHCVPFTHPQDLKIHLAAYPLNQQDYENCSECQTLTVNVTRQVLETATKIRTGRVLEKRYCHYCHARSTDEISFS